MILDYFSSDDSIVQRDLKKIDDLVNSSKFLMALGCNANSAPSAAEFPIVTDINLACLQMTSQEMWDLPEPWPYQYFPGVIEDEAARLEFKTGLSKSKRAKLNEQYQCNIDGFVTACFALINKRFNEYGVENFLTIKMGCEDFEFVNDVLQNGIQAYLQLMLAGIYFGPSLSQSSLFYRMYEAFITGGIPCGWVGSLPEDGGEPKACLQLLHFG
jgi:hypothetical protein